MKKIVAITLSIIIFFVGNYTQVEASTVSSLSNERQQIITKANMMVSMQWKPNNNLIGWQGKSTFKKGTTYTGMPYSQTGNQNSANEYMYYLNNSSSFNFYSKYTAPTKYTMSRFGNDCSGFVSDVWDIERQSTSDFVNGIKNGTYPKVGSYSPTSPKKADLKKAYTYLQPGDAVVKKGHTYLIVSNDIANSKVYVYEQTPPKARKTSFSYESMASSGYMPFTKKSITSSTSSIFKSGTYMYKINSDKKSVTLINGSSNSSSIKLPSTVKYNNKTYKVTSIGSHAFSEYGAKNILKSITIPTNVTNISPYAFAYCKSLQSVSIPSTVKEIGTGAFAGCTSINKMSIPSSNKNFVVDKNIIYSVNKKELISAPSTSGDFTISKNVTKIKSGAFLGNNKVKKVNIPGNVTTVESYAFMDCSNSSFSVLLNKGLKTISEGAFYNSNLKSISLPTSLTYIGENTFAFSKIKEIKIPEGVKKIQANTFTDMPNLNKITLPSTVDSISSKAFIKCYNLNNVSISSKNTNFMVKDNSIYNKNQTTLVKSFTTSSSFEVPSKVTKINDYAFAYRPKLKSVSIKGSVKEISNFAFFNCQLLNNVKMPSSVTAIKSYAFSGCANLKSISLPSNLKSIEGRAFAFTGLTFLTIPSKVTTIGKNMIYDGYLSTITFKSTTPPKISSQMDTVNTVVVPKGKQSVYKKALANNLRYKTIK
ncbi:MAG: leucine-rich repeat domain-containing protein [Peptostreptococcaceae bacterium]